MCALGRATGPQQERGVFRTADGGKHWDRVLFVDENTGCSGLAWTRTIRARCSPACGRWRCTPGANSAAVRAAASMFRAMAEPTWTRLEGHGLPHSPVGKIDVAIAPTDSNRVYALIQTTDQGSLWRSDDGGENWRVVNWDRALIGRAGYYIRLAVSPANENEVLVSNSSFIIRWMAAKLSGTVPWGGDNHDIWIDPTNADRFVITRRWRHEHHHRSRPRLPSRHACRSGRCITSPWTIRFRTTSTATCRTTAPCAGPASAPLGRLSARRRSRLGSRHGRLRIRLHVPDPTDPNIVWATCYGDEVTRWDAKTKLARSVSPWLHTLDSPPNDTKYRCHWTPPLAIDPFDHNTVYYGCQVIFKTTNGGQSWSVISPDLSTQDPSA